MERHTLEDFAISVTSHRAGSIMTQLRSLHSLVVPTAGLASNTGILSSLAARVKVSEGEWGSGDIERMMMMMMM